MPQYLTAQWVTGVLPKRPKTAHKGAFGRLAVLAGSARYPGAALLAAEGALRSGAGIVQVAAVGQVCAAAAVRLPAATQLPLPQTEGGGIAPAGAYAVLQTGPTAILAGCGLGNTGSTARLLGHLLRGAQCPLVLDADALNALAGHLERGQSPRTAKRLQAALAATAAAVPVVLCPHVGEMARLCGMPAAQVQADLAQAALAYAKQTGCVVVLKSNVTHVAAPDGALYINEAAGNPGLAKGGSGDVLAGLIAGLVCQGIAPQKAAAAAVWLHAAAADLAAEEYGLMGLSPQDLPAAIARLLHSLGR